MEVASPRDTAAPSGGALSWCIDTTAAAVVVGTFWLPSLLSSGVEEYRAIGGVLVALAAASMILRWRLPLAASLTAFCVTVIGWLLGVTTDPMLAAAWCVYPLAVRRASRPQVLGLAAVGVVLLLSASVAVPEGPSALGQRVVVAVAAVGAAWLLGHAEGRRLVAIREMERARGEHERTRQQIAMARDVHDVVGHALGGISAEAGVARSLPDADERELRQSLADVEQRARAALEEVQGFVRSLRDAPRASNRRSRGLGSRPFRGCSPPRGQVDCASMRTSTPTMWGRRWRRPPRGWFRSP